MDIKVCKDYMWRQAMVDIDWNRYLEYGGATYTPANREVTFMEEDVNQEQLLEYISRGYAIKINC